MVANTSSEPKLVSVVINGTPHNVPQGSTVLQACERAYVQVPRFCYHEKLKIAGNCRMCLVELGGAPKPVASCAMPVRPGMTIFTDTPLVAKAREAVMEFLLANHPLDCPICDQAGECDLQDQRYIYGRDRSRFYLPKRGVADKHVGQVIKMVMTRCIHCTRCVRFLSEVAGTGEFAMTARGSAREIGTYVEKGLKSPLSGNLIDLCPVGALTAKPYAFQGRPWEAKTTYTVDTIEGDMLPIVIENAGYNDGRRIRIQPAEGDWIRDRTRFGYDSLDYLKPTSLRLNSVVAEGLRITDLELLDTAFEKVLDQTKWVRLVPQLESNRPSRWGINAEKGNIAEHRDYVVLVGTHIPRLAPVLMAEIQQRFFRGAQVVTFGSTGEEDYLINGGNTVADVISFIEGRHPLSVKFAQAKTPTVLFSADLWQRPQSNFWNAIIDRLVQRRPQLMQSTWAGLGIVPTFANLPGYAMARPLNIQNGYHVRLKATNSQPTATANLKPLALQNAQVCTGRGELVTTTAVANRSASQQYRLTELLNGLYLDDEATWRTPRANGLNNVFTREVGLDPIDFSSEVAYEATQLQVSPYWTRLPGLSAQRKVCRSLELERQANQANHS